MFGEKKRLLSPDKVKAREKSENDAEDARYADMVSELDEQNAAPEIKKEAGPEIAKFTELILGFEREHSLEALHLVINLTAEEAKAHPVREPARVALKDIASQLKRLKKEVNISPQIFEGLTEAYRRISRAVGIISKGKIRHT